MLTTQKPWVVVGGGMLGLSVALRLAQRGEQVTLLEAAPQLGGLADAWRLGDVTWDRHYHVILLSDLYTRQLLAEIGLEQDLVWRTTKTGFLVDNQLHSFSSVWDFLRFPPLSLIDKFRLGWTIRHAAAIQHGEPLEAIPVGEWLTRLSGKRTFERIWLPLLRAKLGENHTKASAAFIWSTIQRLYAARRTGLKREMFGYVRGGYGKVLSRLRQHLSDLGVELRTAFPVQQIRRDEGGLLVQGPQEQLLAKQVVVTAPAPVAAALCVDLTAEERGLLAGVEYQGIVCASLLLKERLAPYYITNITDHVPFTAVIEMTALVDPAELGGNHLVYLPRYLPLDSPLWNETDDTFREQFLAALERIYPHFQRDQVLAFRISRARHVLPIPTLHYSQRLPPRITSVPGLFLVNSAHIVNGTLNVNETLRLADDSLAWLPAQAERADEGEHPGRACHVTAAG